MGSMDFQAFQALLVTASKAPQGTQVTKEHPALRALQEKEVPQDWACQAPKASVVSLEILGYLDHQVSLAPLAPLALQD